jgi:alcohol dehydrogenase
VALAAALLPRAVALLERADTFACAEATEALVVATLAGALQDATSVGLAHGLAHALEPRTHLGHGALLAAFLAPVVRWNREKSPAFDGLCAAAGLAPEPTLARLEELAARHGFTRPPVPRDPDFVTALVRDPCTRTNCRAARPSELGRLLESL